MTKAGRAEVTGHTKLFRVTGIVEAEYEEECSECGQEVCRTIRGKVDRTVLAESEDEAEHAVLDWWQDQNGDEAWEVYWWQGPEIEEHELPEDQRMRLVGAVPLAGLECL